MCDWSGVSPSGFYEWRERPASATAETACCAGGGRQARLRRLEWHLWLPAGSSSRWCASHGPTARPCGVFSAEAPGTKLAGDITYIPTWQGWLYLATVIDCHTKGVVGWSMADHLRASLVGDALKMVYGNIDIVEDCVLHSDSGTQHTSAEYRGPPEVYKILPSVGRTGICWDNALAESFFASLKNERVHRTVFPSRRHARRAVAHHIEVWCNRRRLDSGLWVSDSSRSI
jgi:putative transposase